MSTDPVALRVRLSATVTAPAPPEAEEIDPAVPVRRRDAGSDRARRECGGEAVGRAARPNPDPGVPVNARLTIGVVCLRLPEVAAKVHCETGRRR
ncbi:MULTISPECIES: hypothetical protein [Nocardia]|uniref:hypothetical protein n=1 Tax=Nocardia TaxID=1817 RepID=UPI00245830FF|nr:MULTISPECIES: hypothetical protein [Nocardia]